MATSAAVKAAIRESSKTRASGTGSNIRHGRYIFMIDKWYFRDGFKGVSDIHELVVTKAEKVTVMEDDKRVEQEPNQVGSSCSAVFAHHGNSKVMGPINTVRFLQALFGIDDDSISEDEKQATLDDATGESNPTRGMLIACETFPVRTQAGKWITACKWSCVAPPGEGVNTKEEATKRWAEYEARRSGKTEAAA